MHRSLKRCIKDGGRKEGNAGSNQTGKLVQGTDCTKDDELVVPSKGERRDRQTKVETTYWTAPEFPGGNNVLVKGSMSMLSQCYKHFAPICNVIVIPQLLWVRPRLQLHVIIRERRKSWVEWWRWLITRNAPENQTDCNSLPDLFHTVLSKKHTPLPPFLPPPPLLYTLFLSVPLTNTNRNQKRKRKRKKEKKKSVEISRWNE